MTNYIHKTSPVAQNHPATPVMFLGDPADFTPVEAGYLVIRDDAFPRELYLTTGPNEGDVEFVGFLFEKFTGNPYTYYPHNAGALLLKTDGNNPSLWYSTGTTQGALQHIAGAVLGSAGSPFGSVVADFALQLCIDTSNQMLYYSRQYGSTNWTALDGLGGGGST